jgi:ribosomal protein S18 acetylase RimI-like enzyme
MVPRRRPSRPSPGSCWRSTRSSGRDLSFRVGTPDDLAALVVIDTVRTPERRSEIAAWLEAGQCHLALRDDRIVGYAALTRGFYHRCFLEMLMIAATERRTGIGRALIAHCLTQLPAGEDFWGSTNQSNTPMQALFASLAFVPSGIIENLDEGDPELIYLLRRG